MSQPKEFKLNDTVVVADANPATRIKGVVKSAPYPSSEGIMYIVGWEDGTSSGWRTDRLELYKPPG